MAGTRRSCARGTATRAMPPPARCPSPRRCGAPCVARAGKPTGSLAGRRPQTHEIRRRSRCRLPRQPDAAGPERSVGELHLPVRPGLTGKGNGRASEIPTVTLSRTYSGASSVIPWLARPRRVGAAVRRVLRRLPGARSRESYRLKHQKRDGIFTVPAARGLSSCRRWWRLGSRYGSYGPLRLSRNWEIWGIGSQSPSPWRSQLCHAFAEPRGYMRTRKDTKSSAIEYRRTLEEPPGYGRTRH